MPSDLTGLSSADRVRLPSAPSTQGTGAAASSTALTRVEPVDPRQPAANAAHPLGRSGLDLLDLLATTDLVASRERTGPVALEVGLELARSSLLRNLPGDALAALDLVWDGARRTEEGWYLRTGSLSVLGLPGESDRVAEEGIAERPASIALRFLQSVSRLAVGDVSGARAALEPALQRAPKEPVLLVQQALIQAKQGDTRGADALFARATPAEHPAITWGRIALRAMVADATRQRSRPTPADWPAAIPPRASASLIPAPDAADIFPDITGIRETPDSPRHSATPRATDSVFDSNPGESLPADVASSALGRFGARVMQRPMDEVAREARMLMRAFSAGGTLASATNAEQAHAARTILATFLGIATGEGAETPTTVRTTVEQLVPLLQSRRFEEAERALRRQSTMSREPIGRLLLAIVRGAWAAEDASGRVGSELAESDGARAARTTPPLSQLVMRNDGTPELGSPVVRGDSERSPVVPVRLGLGLLDETPASRAAAEHALVRSPGGSMPSVRDEDWRSSLSGGSAAVRNAEADGSGWGAARALPLPADSMWTEGAGVRAVALVCVALAAAALVTSHGAIAIGLGAGAVWLGLRRSGREGDGARTHDGTPPQ